MVAIVDSVPIPAGSFTPKATRASAFFVMTV